MLPAFSRMTASFAEIEPVDSASWLHRRVHARPGPPRPWPARRPCSAATSLTSSMVLSSSWLVAEISLDGGGDLGASRRRSSLTVGSCCLLVAAISVAVDISSIDDRFTRATSAFRLARHLADRVEQPAGLVVAGGRQLCREVAARHLRRGFGRELDAPGQRGREPGRDPGDQEDDGDHGDAQEHERARCWRRRSRRPRARSRWFDSVAMRTISSTTRAVLLVEPGGAGCAGDLERLVAVARREAPARTRRRAARRTRSRAGTIDRPCRP